LPEVLLRRLTLIFFLFFFVSLLAFSQAKRPFTFEDMMKLKRVGEPVPSPDGKWVLFSAVDVSLEANTKIPHVWIVPTAGGESREIIFTQESDRPRWAPDGKRFAFLSTKEGGSQIWIADFDGAAGTVTGVQELTALATETDGEVWSPDGKNILFTSDVYPECDGAPAEEQDCNAKKLKEAEQSKVKALIFDHLLYRHWNAYKGGKRTHIFVVPDVLASARSGAAGAGIATPPPRDLTPGDYDSPVFSLGGQDNYAFSPDGQEICYTSNHDKVEAASTNNDLWVVPVNGGTAKNITADNPASDSTPLYSPDGKYIAYRAQQRPGYESDRFRLMLCDRKTGEQKNVTEDFDHWVGSFVWAPDSKTIYFSAEHEGHSLIYTVAMDSTGKTAAAFSKHALVGGFNDDLVVKPDGKTLVFTRMSVGAPTEIYASNTAGEGCPARTGNVDPGKEDCSLNTDWAITKMNEAVLSQVSMSKIESFSFPGANGDSVEGFLVKPPNFDASKKYPLKFIIHGGPEVPMGDLWSYRWNAQLFAASGYVVIMINFHGSPG
jgi:dipeptidyl aminopeptidase/acylaminoacyl peptidase